MHETPTQARTELETTTGALSPAEEPRLFRLALVGALLLGLAVRAYHVLSYDFPLNDGGLFYMMAGELRDAGYRLPAQTDYNGIGAPFAYPPFGLYVAALLADVTPLALIDLFRLLPLLVSVATVAAFGLLAGAMLRSTVAVVAAVVAFALVPRSFIWLLMGGGVTRAFGILFALLALHQVYLLYTRRSARYEAPAAVFAALTVLSHLETAWFLAYSIVLFFLAFGRHRQGLLSSAAIALGTALLTAPWWGSVLAEHGLSPFVAASHTNDSILSDAGKRRYLLFSLLRFVFTGEALFPIIGTIALLGVLVCVLTRRPFLPLWWAVIILLSGRSYPTLTMVPLALLAGIGVAEVLLPLASRLVGREGSLASPVADAPPAGASPPVDTKLLQTVPLLALFVGLLCYATFSALTKHRSLGGEAVALVGLSADERAAMRWVARELPPDSRVLVVTGGQWWTDKTAEWFPVLARRHSIATVQGTEWLPGGAYRHREWVYELAQRCAERDTACLDEWQSETGWTFTHVYVAQAGSDVCCRSLRAALAAHAGYDRVYDGLGAAIFVRRDAASRDR